MTAPPHQRHSTMIETAQSLIVAFVLAMTFRGFVTEGFVIPTGSMAPTLLGQHVLMESRTTGLTFPVGINSDKPDMPHEALRRAVADPMLGPDHPGSGASRTTPTRRMGDRILVLKSLFPFSEPDRFDVVVFKNPTDPDGKSANYIKRLVGLPNERIWLADGDVFVAPNEERDPDPEDPVYRIQRKPHHVQMAVWQPVHHSDYVPLRPLDYPWDGPPWKGDGWDTGGRSYRCDTAAPTELRWDGSVRQIDDWNSYNVVSARSRRRMRVSDLRVTATVAAHDPTALDMTFQIATRGHEFQFVVRGGTATVRMRRTGRRGGDWTESEAGEFDLPAPGGVFNVEFWHVDQALAILVDDEPVARLEYDWTGRERMQHAGVPIGWSTTGKLVTEHPELSWRFRGSALTLHRVRTDRDLFYRSQPLRDAGKLKNPAPPDGPDLLAESLYAAAAHISRPAVLGPDHFFMLGDNSPASLDSRLWGHAHPLIAHQVDPSPFVVHRKLIIGKAWVVYFPAPYTLTQRGMPVIPDFGRLRFIR